MKKFLRHCAISAVFVLAMALPSFAQAADTAVLSWTANTETDLAGYKVYQSTTSGVYSTPTATLGRVSTYTAVLPARIATGVQTFYFTITAYDIAGNESPKSLQVSKTIPALDLPPATPIGVAIQ